MKNWVERHKSPVDLEILEESALAMAQSTIQNAINDAVISQADLARKMGRNRSIVSRILSGNHNLTIKTMARSLAACGFEVRFERVPIEWSWQAIPQTTNNVPTAHPVSTVSIGMVA